MPTENLTDTLAKPDMVAVLSRTHFGTDVHSFLLPIMEAISNAMHGIEEKFDADASTKGKIELKINNLNDPHKIHICITDNGVGLDDINYNFFKTPFSGHKLQQKGRGFGRFISFKVFSKVLYSSRYEFFADQSTRTFRFDIYNEKEFTIFDGTPDFTGTGVRVEYETPFASWQELIRELKKEEITEEIGSHFLPYFLYKWLPKITIQFDDEPAEEITSHFKKIFVEYDKGDLVCEIDGKQETLAYSLTKIQKTRLFKNHCLLLSAGDRLVGSPRDLTNKLGQPHFVDDKNEKYIILAIVRGDVFEGRLNDSRTSIDIPPKAVEDIVSRISDVIQKKERAQIDKIKKDQSEDLAAALRENPILRIGLRGRTVSEYVSGKPNNWDSERFISDLAIERYRASNDLSKSIASAANSSENYTNEIKKIVSQLDANKKEALAEYVIHRKKIIELVEAARKFGKDGKHSPEDTIHDLVFKRFTDNTVTDYFEHNLWIIDDALAFLPYIASDRTMHGGRRQAGDKVSDLVFFDDSVVLGDNDSTTLTIVEFKKPSRNDYSFGDTSKDPVRQVTQTLEKATREGGITKADGSHFSFEGVVRKFAYIVADLTPSLIAVLKEHDFRKDANPKIFCRFRDNEQIFIQVFGYETLVDNAKKRNEAFFSVLLGKD